jgi:hypothetical protein
MEGHTAHHFDRTVFCAVSTSRVHKRINNSPIYSVSREYTCPQTLFLAIGLPAELTKHKNRCTLSILLSFGATYYAGGFDDRIWLFPSRPSCDICATKWKIYIYTRIVESILKSKSSHSYQLENQNPQTILTRAPEPERKPSKSDPSPVPVSHTAPALV